MRPGLNRLKPGLHTPSTLLPRNIDFVSWTQARRLISDFFLISSFVIRISLPYGLTHSRKKPDCGAVEFVCASTRSTGELPKSRSSDQEPLNRSGRYCSA